MKIQCLFVGLLLSLSGVTASLGAQQRSVEYEISFARAEVHDLQVTATFRGVPKGPLQLRMSRSSPGRYAIHNFAKNVYDVTATDGRGRGLSITRPDPHGWSVSGHDGTVKVTYTVWGDRIDGTYLGVDRSHAHMNMPATFMWARGMTQLPIRLRIVPRSGWRVATQLVATGDSTVFTAPHLQYFMDSPTEVGPVSVRSWPVRYGARTYTIRLAVHHVGTEAQLDTFAEMAKKVVDEQIGMFGEPAAYDFGTYTFIADYLPWASGDGMEHRNSTILTSRRTLADSANRLGVLGTLSHEFFHSWNVERLRPRSLEPFDFERENMSGELWFAEGFTNYYDDLFIRRAGLLSDAQYAAIVGSQLNAVINAPGRRHFSAVEMSMQAPFVDAAASIDPVNQANLFLSYYTWGAAIGLGLDLTLRNRFNLALDDYMRALWIDFGRPQTPSLAPQRPYTIADLRRALGALTRDTAFADDFFRRFIEGREVPEYDRLLGSAGFLLAKAAPGKAWLGVTFANDTSVVIASAAENGAAHPAGIATGDTIVSVNGVRASSPADVNDAINARRVGDVVQVVIQQRGERRTVDVRLVENPELRLTPYEGAGLPVTEAMLAMRRSWLGSRAKR